MARGETYGANQDKPKAILSERLRWLVAKDVLVRRPAGRYVYEDPAGEDLWPASRRG
jgi:hypothetical protein